MMSEISDWPQFLLSVSQNICVGMPALKLARYKTLDFGKSWCSFFNTLVVKNALVCALSCLVLCGYTGVTAVDHNPKFLGLKYNSLSQSANEDFLASTK